MRTRFDEREYKRLKNIYAKSRDENDMETIRYYLDSCGYFMTTPKYQYKFKDKSTWKYLNGSFRKLSNGSYKYYPVLNPEFSYK